MQRRHFLQQAGLAAAATAFPTVTSAIQPVQRNLPALFKFSMAAYSYRDLMTGDAPQLTLEDFVRDCARFGLQGTELTSYYFPKGFTADYVNQLKQLTFQLGLDVSGTAVGNDFCQPLGEVRQREIAGVKEWVDHAAALGAPVIRIFSGSAQGDPAEAHRLAVEAIEECCDYAGTKGVYLALENHGGLTETASGILSLVHDVKSPWFGVNLDTGNFHSSDPYAELVQLAPYALNVQIKVMVSSEGGEKQPSRFDVLAKMLRDVGYRGYVVLEYEEPEDPRTACPRYIDQMREAFVA